MFIRVATAAVVAVIAATGCGSQSDGQQIEAALAQFADGVANGDGAQTCDVLTGPYQRNLLSSEISGACPARIEQYSESLGSEEKEAFSELKVTGIVMHGSDKALACTSTPQPNAEFKANSAYNMEKFSGSWKIASTNDIGTC